jgi:hypothetical protein
MEPNPFAWFEQESSAVQAPGFNRQTPAILIGCLGL